MPEWRRFGPDVVLTAMARRFGALSDRLFHRVALWRWNRVREEAATADLLDLRATRQKAREVRARINEILHVADQRLTLPLLETSAIQKPLHSDWAYRPEVWRGPLRPSGIAGAESRAKLGTELSIFHDCPIAELTLRQVRNRRENDLAPFGLSMDVLRFDGTFLSLVIELPPEAADGLTRRHLVRLNAVMESEQPVDVFARLNFRHGPNTEQVVRELPKNETDIMVEFDLAYTGLNEKRIESVWVELIFDKPAMNQITLRDVTLSRRPRAEV